VYHLIDARPHGGGVHRLRKARADVVGCEREAPCVCVSDIALVPGVLTVVLPVESAWTGTSTGGTKLLRNARLVSVRRFAADGGLPRASKRCMSNGRD
jgi:hypothetical protein